MFIDFSKPWLSDRGSFHIIQIELHICLRGGTARCQKLVCSFVDVLPVLDINVFPVLDSGLTGRTTASDPNLPLFLATSSDALYVDNTDTDSDFPPKNFQYLPSPRWHSV